jgi:phosphoglycolate phosphatase
MRDTKVFANADKFNIDAVMFDLDGTIIDSVPVYYQILAQAFAALGLPPASNETIAEAIKDGDFNWDLVLPPTTTARKQALIRSARQLIDRISTPMLQNDIALFPGAADALLQIHANGMKLGLVTSTPQKNMALKLAPLKKAGIEHLFEAVITGDDVCNKKPAAEPLVMGHQRLGVPAHRCAYVGDMRLDIRAGKAAGMWTIGVLTGFDRYDTLLSETPDAIVASIACLGHAIFGVFFPPPKTDPKAAGQTLLFS